jgi:hypothetical protein
MHSEINSNNNLTGILLLVAARPGQITVEDNSISV